MPRLQPLKVPWSISPSTPSLGITTKSFNGVNHGFVTFMGFLGEQTVLKAEYGTYRQVAIVLDSIIAIRMYPEFSAEDSKRIEDYDWEAIPEFRDDDGSLKNHVRHFHDQWNSTNVCPNPSSYIVENSEWLRQLRFDPEGPKHLQFHHYLFIGDDYNVEVIAKSMKWEIVTSHALH